MAVVAFCPGSLRQYAALYAGAVRKLAAVVYGDRLEHAREKLAPFLFQIVEGLHHAGRAFVQELGRDLIPGESLGQDEDRSLARSGAHYGVHFPVPEGGTIAISFAATASLSSTFNLTFVVTSLLETYGAAERIFKIEDTMPDGYQTDMGQMSARLSGGERQRIGIARIFLRDPDLCLMDEPSSALDALHEKELLHTLKTEYGEKTLLLISHRNSTLIGCDQILHLKPAKA